MTTYAETQERINGPYAPTNLTLRQCWDSDLGNMTDYNLLRDNAEADDLAILEAWIHANPDEATEDAMIERIWQRVEARGWYVRDGKTTRAEGGQL